MRKQSRVERDEYIWQLFKLGFVASGIQHILRYGDVKLTTKQIRRIIEKKSRRVE